MAAPEAGYDVVIIGGALAGASTAVLLLQAEPRLRVAIVEKSARFGRRVGEATIEVSTYFLTHCLGLSQHLNQFHLTKQGLRFWFANGATTALDECSEIGGRYLARVPAFQVDRAVLDEEVLARARELGAAILRPCQVLKVALMAGARQTITIRSGNRTEELTARWVVDGSGVAAFLARQQGWWRPNKAHPTTAVWSRWRGVKDWDCLELARRFPRWSMACYGIRNTATNHLMGDGWWAWVIPLKGGDVSVGVVFDQRLVVWPDGDSLGQRLKQFLTRHPAGRELLEEAQWQEGDVHWRKNLPYSSTTYAGDGFALVGDAAAFLDPFYSPGMDWITFTAVNAQQLILAQYRGESIESLVAEHNRVFRRSYEYWFEAVYRDKYFYMGDYQLMRLSFLLDLGFYYMGVASQPFKRGMDGLKEPLFTTRPSLPVYHLMRTYNRRFARLAGSRRARGKFGQMNRGTRFMFKGYTFGVGSVQPIAMALLEWFKLELTEGWRTWFTKPEQVSAVEPIEALEAAGEMAGRSV